MSAIGGNKEEQKSDENVGETHAMVIFVIALQAVEQKTRLLRKLGAPYEFGNSRKLEIQFGVFFGT